MSLPHPHLQLCGFGFQDLIASWVKNTGVGERAREAKAILMLSIARPFRLPYLLQLRATPLVKATKHECWADRSFVHVSSAYGSPGKSSASIYIKPPLIPRLPTAGIPL